MLKFIDLPPLWLVLFVMIVWVLSMFAPQATFTFSGQKAIAGALVMVGTGLAILAVIEMRKAKTTIIPHQSPKALVASGVFRFSRNPIYLADVILLVASVIWTGSHLGLPLIPVFMWVIAKRFILPEEIRLRAAFGPSFDAWARTTRRWI